MTIYKRTTSRNWIIAWPRLPAGRLKLSTGTTHEKTAAALDRMLDTLRHRREADLLNAVATGSLRIGVLYDAWAAGDLAGLRSRLADVDLEPLVGQYLERLVAKVAADTVAHYTHTIRSLIPAGTPFPRSRFTVDALDAWLAQYPGAPATRRKAHAAMSGFAQHLIRAHVIPSNPLRAITPPRAGPPRLRYLDVPALTRLADAQPEPYRTLSALLAGTGIDVSTAITLRLRDVDVKRREIRAAGTKTHARDRIVRVAEWAWPYLRRRCRGLTSDALLFPTINRFTASDKHRDACSALSIEGYQLRDQRHSYAVRAARAGTPIELIARQLGHVDATLALKVYGRFLPSEQERDRWERIAAAHDRAAAKKVGALVGAGRRKARRPKVAKSLQDQAGQGSSAG